MIEPHPEQESSRTVQISIADLGLESTRDERPWLLVRMSSGRVVDFIELAEGREITAGRSSGAEFQVPGDAVSGRHARFLCRRGEVFVEDAGSTNGTWLATSRVQAGLPVPAGAEVVLGRSPVVVMRGDPQELRGQLELERDLARAEDYVRGILPDPLVLPDLRIDWRFRPAAKIGGDVFGYAALDEDRLAIHLVDVSGHGLGSALHSVSIANQIRQMSLPGVDFGDPAAVLEGLNEAYPMEAHGGNFFTIWYGVFDRRRRRLDFASAGHPAALFRSAPGSIERLSTPNMAIGMLAGLPFVAAARDDVLPGSRLYIFSDGAFEIIHPDGHVGSEADLAATIAATPAPEAAEILDQALRRTRQNALDDDFSLLVIAFT